MKINKQQHPARIRHSMGVSLIELLIALVIAGLLALGLVQIFGASRSTSQLQDGLSRVQENGRFVTQFMERQLRMVGFMGCGADTGRFTQESFVNHLALFDGSVPDGNPYRFQRPIEAFTAGTMTATDELAAEPIVDGTDVLILRVMSDESTPVVTISKASNDLSVVIGDPGAAFLPAAGDKVLMAMENCRSADIFAASLNGTTPGSAVEISGATAPNVYLDPSVTDCGAGSCPWDFRISNAFLNAKPLVGAASLNAEIHRAEYYALYVKANAAGIPSLYMIRFKRTSSELNDPEELVEGVENMQLRFGIDTGNDGAIDEYRTAEKVVDGAVDDATLDQNWRRVLSIRIGVAIRSADKAGVPSIQPHPVMGVDLTPATNDNAIREVYETTIALRNRLFNS